MNYAKNTTYNYEITDMQNSISEAARFYKYYLNGQDVNKNQNKQQSNEGALANKMQTKA